MEASEYFNRLTRRELPIVLDDDTVAAAAAERGFSVARFDDADFSTSQAPPSLVLLTRPTSIPRLHSLWGSSEARFCYLALAKFDGSSRAVAYALDQLLALDHAAALARRAETYDQMLSCQDIEIVTRAGVLRCHMKDELEIANAGATIEPGWLYSIAEFFEASVVNLEGERSSFWVEGDITCDALISLCNTEDVKENFAPLLDDLRRRVAADGGALRFVDNRLERLVVGGDDITSLLLEATKGKELEAAVTEIGLGCADLPAPEQLDLNVVLHKSRVGAYVGIGKGHHLPHVDFIAKGAEIRFVSAA